MRASLHRAPAASGFNATRICSSCQARRRHGGLEPAACLGPLNTDLDVGPGLALALPLARRLAGQFRMISQIGIAEVVVSIVAAGAVDARLDQCVGFRNASGRDGNRRDGQSGHDQTFSTHRILPTKTRPRRFMRSDNGCHSSMRSPGGPTDDVTPAFEFIASGGGQRQPAGRRCNSRVRASSSG